MTCICLFAWVGMCEPPCAYRSQRDCFFFSFWDLGIRLMFPGSQQTLLPAESCSQSYLQSHSSMSVLLIFFYLCEEYFWNFHLDYTKSVDCFKFLQTFNIIITSIQEHRMFYFLLQYCSLEFYDLLKLLLLLEIGYNSVTHDVDLRLCVT